MSLVYGKMQPMLESACKMNETSLVYSKTQLESACKMNETSLVDGKMQPMLE